MAFYFTAELGKVWRRERKGIQLGFGFIVLFGIRLQEAESLCAPLRKPLRSLRLNLVWLFTLPQS
jgi:hypothetical protein